MTKKIDVEGAAESYLTAEEASEILGVTRATLYSYVSRHGIRSKLVAGSKQRLYWKDDILIAKRPRGRPRGSKMESLHASAISLISETHLYYRGRDAIELAQTATFEEVASLLWDGSPEDLFTPRLPEFPAVATRIGAMMEDASGSERAIAMLPLIETANPRAFDLSPAGLTASGADVIRSVAAIILRTHRPSAAPLHEQIGQHFKLTLEWQDLVRRLLVLSADLGFEPTAVAVRSVASVGVSPYRSVLAGLLLLGARRTQLGRMEGVSGLLDEIIEHDPEEAIVRRLREGSSVPGFGGVYASGDPRAFALLDALARIDSHQPHYQKLERAIRIVHDALGVHPSFALIGHYAGRWIGHDRRDSLVALGRCAGWVAHAKEQYQTRESGRPMSIYVGSLPHPS